jgi:hypothetical protein
MRPRPLLLVLSAALAVVAGCGSSGPPSASSLAQKIPGCAHVTADTPAVDEVQQVGCIRPDGAVITVGTFSSSANETQWISTGGDPAASDPAFSGCCIQGSGWAATVGFNAQSGPVDVDYQSVISAIGGREVQG